jgi:2-polyprenyl-6-methoxyphenol hydroxylase-like FAD-dependent oxidoreductase
MRILVVGAGIAGLTAAYWLQQGGHQVTVYERHPRLRNEGYMIDFFGPGFGVVERMNLVDRLRAIHYAVRYLQFVSPQGRPRARIDYPRVHTKMFLGKHFNLLRGELEEVLFDFVAPGVEVRLGTSPAVITNEDQRVVVEDQQGSREAFDLVIGADGVRSTVRELCFPRESWREIYLGCHTAAYVFPGSPTGLSREDFSTLSDAWATVGAYPVRRDRTATFFVHAAAERTTSRTPDACRDELIGTYRDRGWIVEDLLAGFERREDLYFDDVIQVEVDRWSRGRVVLVGDACGCVSLVAGQGASMAVAGAYVLAQELTRTPADIPSALRRYEARIRPAVTMRQRSGRRNASLFLPHSRFGAAVRDRLMGLAVASPFAPAFARLLGAGALPLD